MHCIDWLILIIPFAFIAWLAISARRYVHGVVDYVAAGRVAGRYVMSVGEMESAMSVLILVSLAEKWYECGFAMTFWNNLLIPISLMLALTGFCTYRYRETKVLSAGQLLELRYSRSLRIIAAILRTMAEMTTNALAPAIAARYFMYFFNIVPHFTLFGITFSTFTLTAFIIITLAVLMILPAGRISLLITDCIQGLLAFPIFLLIIGFVLFNFSWSEQIVPVLANRVTGESFINPYDLQNLRDFNLFSLGVLMVSRFISRASWLGGESSSAGRTPHEQKMAGVLSTFRSELASVICVILALMLITVYNDPASAPKARELRMDLIQSIAREKITDPVKRDLLISRVEQLQASQIYKEGPKSRLDNPDTPYMNAIHDVLGHDPSGNRAFQEFRSLYSQMRLPVTAKNLFPIGLLGLFALLSVTLMISTDSGRIMNSSVIISQDMILPFLKNTLTPKKQLLLIRCCIVGVGAYFFFATTVMSQLDYVQLFYSLLCAIWNAGAGPIMVFGLYTRWGTTAGAYAAMICGSGTTILSFICQQTWAEHLYPWLQESGMIKYVDSVFKAVTNVCSPVVVWEMNPVKFPINTYEINIISYVIGFVAYIVVSKMTMKEPFNLERLLHRGQYSDTPATEAETAAKTAPAKKPGLIQRIIGITPNYTRGDKIIAWAAFSFSFIYSLLIIFACVVICNLFSPWEIEDWSRYFFITGIVMPTTVTLIYSVWMTIGGISDLRKLFQHLATRKNDDSDNGMVRDK